MSSTIHYATARAWRHWTWVHWLLVGTGLAVLLFACFVWPTFYRYDKLRRGQVDDLVRTHRITGNTEILDRYGGWRIPSPQVRLRNVPRTVADVLDEGRNTTSRGR